MSHTSRIQHEGGHSPIDLKRVEVCLLSSIAVDSSVVFFLGGPHTYAAPPNVDDDGRFWCQLTSWQPLGDCSAYVRHSP